VFRGAMLSGSIFMMSRGFMTRLGSGLVSGVTMRSVMRCLRPSGVGMRRGGFRSFSRMGCTGSSRSVLRRSSRGAIVRGWSRRFRRGSGRSGALVDSGIRRSAKRDGQRKNQTGGIFHSLFFVRHNCLLTTKGEP
jgi:hypothetical protein